MSGSFQSILCNAFQSYQKSTNKRMKLLDGFLVYVMLTGVLQFLYCLLVGTFPFNAFLSGFICTVGVFVLTGKTTILWKNSSQYTSLATDANQSIE